MSNPSFSREAFGTCGTVFDPILSSSPWNTVNEGGGVGGEAVLENSWLFETAVTMSPAADPPGEEQSQCFACSFHFPHF